MISNVKIVQWFQKRSVGYSAGGKRQACVRRARGPGTHPHFPAVCVYYDFNVKSDQYGRGRKISAGFGAFRELRTSLAAGLLTYRNTLGCVLSARSIGAK